MAVKPIIFSGPMVQALLELRKTQTRRVLKPQPAPGQGAVVLDATTGLFQIRDKFDNVLSAEKLIYRPGDLLWVREGFGYGSRPHPAEGSVDGIEYRADEAFLDDCDDLPLYTPKTPDDFCYGDVMGDGWRSPIHLPRWASRLTLEVTDVRVQRLQEISEADAEAEGVEWTATDPSTGNIVDRGPAGRDGFAGYWDHLHGDGAWDENPWVAAYSSQVHHRNVDALPHLDKEPSGNG